MFNSDFWRIFIGAAGVPENPLEMSFGDNPIEKVVAVLVVANVVAAVGLISFPLSVVQLKHDPNL